MWKLPSHTIIEILDTLSQGLAIQPINSGVDETNLGGLGDEVFEREGRLPILVLLLELLAYVDHFGFCGNLRFWERWRRSLKGTRDGDGGVLVV